MSWDKIKNDVDINHFVKEENFYEIRAEWTLSPQCIMMLKKEFFLSTLNDNAPIIEVKLKSIKKFRDIDSLDDKDEKFIIVNALIDTGAPNSLIDTTILNSKIEIVEMQYTYKINLFDGTSEILPVYKVGFELLTDISDDLERCFDTPFGLADLTKFKISNTNIELLIGRDILKNCVFIYDGLNNKCTLNYKI